MAERYDVVIIGAGPGGYVAAIRAGQLGLRTAVVEKAELGGVCLNWGCIPSKVLLHHAEVVRKFQRARDYGIAVDGWRADYGRAVQRSRRVVNRLVKGVGFLLKKNKVEVIAGEGYVAAADTESFAGKRFGVVVRGESEQDLKADNVIVATGSRPRSIPGVEINGERILTSRQAIVLDELPSSIIIIGASAVGVEFAYVFQSYGCQVTLLEMLPQVLPLEDSEVADLLEKSFTRQGMTVHTSTRVESVMADEEGVTVRASSEQGGLELRAEKALVAVGRAPNSEGLGLEALGVKIDRGFIQVDGMMRSNVPGVYAIGDVAGPPLLAHKAMHEGIVAVEHIAGLQPVPVDHSHIPSCTYCQPQVASIGLTEAQAVEQGYEIKVGRFPFRGIGKALAIHDYEGFVKLVVDAQYGEILGAHIIGPEATELIHELALARTAELTPDEIVSTIHAHPTLHEAIGEVALAVDGRAIHI